MWGKSTKMRQSMWGALSETEASSLRRRALGVVLIYAVAGALWILLSDHVVDALVRDAALLSRVQTFKGWFYILITSLMLYALLRVATRRHLEHESAFRAVFDNTGEAIFIHDAHTGELLDVNNAMLEMYGVTKEEILSRSVTQLTSGEDPYTSEEAVRRVQQAAAGNDQQFTWHARRPN